jgi:hypothetical protein
MGRISSSLTRRRFLRPPKFQKTMWTWCRTSRLERLLLGMRSRSGLPFLFRYHFSLDKNRNALTRAFDVSLAHHIQRETTNEFNFGKRFCHFAHCSPSHDCTTDHARTFWLRAELATLVARTELLMQNLFHCHVLILNLHRSKCSSKTNEIDAH